MTNKKIALTPFQLRLLKHLEAKGFRGRRAYLKNKFPDGFFMDTIELIARNFGWDGGAHYHISVSETRKPEIIDCSFINIDKTYPYNYFRAAGQGETDALYLAAFELGSGKAYGRHMLHKNKLTRKVLRISDTYEGSDYFNNFHRQYGFSDAASIGFPVDDLKSEWHFFSFMLYKADHERKWSIRGKQNFIEKDLENIKSATDIIRPVGGLIMDDDYPGRVINPSNIMATYDEYKEFASEVKELIDHSLVEANDTNHPDVAYRVVENMVDQIRERVSDFSPNNYQKWEVLCPALKEWTNSRKRADRERVLREGSGLYNFETADEFFRRVMHEAKILNEPFLDEVRAVHPPMASGLKTRADHLGIPITSFIKVRPRQPRKK